MSRLPLFVREDVRDAIRERQFHVLAGLYLLLSLLVTYNAGRSSGGEEGVVDPLLPMFALFTPLLALGFFAPVVVGRRTDGALKVVLGLPISRATVVLGTFVGRSVVICAAVVAALVAAVPVALFQGTGVDPVRFVGTVLLLSLLGATFTALAVGVSAVARTTTRATAAAVGLFVLFFFELWASLPRAVLYVRHGFSMPETTPEWVAFVEALNPVAAYTNLLAGLFPDLNAGTLVRPPEDPALYERPAFALGVLLAWIVVSVALGYHRFRSTDL